MVQAARPRRTRKAGETARLWPRCIKQRRCQRRLFPRSAAGPRRPLHTPPHLPGLLLPLLQPVLSILTPMLWARPSRLLLACRLRERPAPCRRLPASGGGGVFPSLRGQAGKALVGGGVAMATVARFAAGSVTSRDPAGREGKGKGRGRVADSHSGLIPAGLLPQK